MAKNVSRLCTWLHHHLAPSRYSDDLPSNLIRKGRCNRTGAGKLDRISNRKWKWYQFRETVTDPKAWPIVVIILAGNVPTGATGSFSCLLIKPFDYRSKQATLLNIPSGFVQALAVIIASIVAGRGNARSFAIFGLLLPGVLGKALMAFLPSSPRSKGGNITGIYLCGIFGPNLSIMYSWTAANFAGHTKKVTINGMILAAYGASNIVEPLTFTGYTAPQHVPAKVALMTTLALGILTTLVLRLLVVRETKMRERNAMAAEDTDCVQDIEFMDLTYHENTKFRVCSSTIRITKGPSLRFR